MIDPDVAQFLLQTLSQTQFTVDSATLQQIADLHRRAVEQLEAAYGAEEANTSTV